MLCVFVQVVAGMRALESEKGEDAIVRDRFAGALAQEDGIRWLNTLAPRHREFMVDMLAVRTAFIDQWLEGTLQLPRHSGAGSAPLACGASGQLVIIGSGLDSRAYRLPCLAPVLTLEVDFREVHEYKRSILGALPDCAPLGRAVSVEADLALPSWSDSLVAAGFDASRPAVFLLEGLIGYLTEDEARALLSKVASLCAPGSDVLITFIGTNFFSGAGSTTPGLAEPSPVDPASPMAPGKTMGQLHKFKTDTGDALLLECGFNAVTRTGLGDLAVKYKRRIPASFGYYFVHAEKTE